MHKFFNKADIPWVKLIWEKYYPNGRLPSIHKKGSFWWKNILKLLDKYKGIANVTAKDGTTCLLWEDCWTGQPLKLAFLELFSFAKKPHISLSEALAINDPNNLFVLPLSEQAFLQLQTLTNQLIDQAEFSGNDVWSYIWGM